MPLTENILTAPFTKIAANGRGDLQRALKSSARSQAALFQNGIINPMAKYKAVALAGVYENITDAQRKSVRYGLGEPPVFYPGSMDTAERYPQAWSYVRPTLGTHPFRPMDFNGYDVNAAPPIVLDDQMTIAIQEAFALFLWKDGGVNNSNAIAKTTRRWYQDRSLSVQEIAQSKMDIYGGCYIGFAFWDMDGYSSDVNVVVTNKKFGDIGTTAVFIFWPQGDGTQTGDHVESGLHYPQIPLLNQPYRMGHRFRVAVCLINGFPDDPILYAYKLRESETMPCYSLGFDKDLRTDMYDTVPIYAGDLSGLRARFIDSDLEFTDLGTENILGANWHKYDVTGSVTYQVTTPDSYRFNGAVPIECDVVSETGYTFPIPLPNPPDPSKQYTVSTAINTSAGPNNLTGRINVTFFAYKNGNEAGAVRFSARFKTNTQTVQFENQLSVKF